MIPSLRRHRLAAAASFVVLLACAAHAQSSDPAAPRSPAPIIERPAPSRPGTKPAPAAAAAAAKPAGDPEAQRSALTAELFYEILMGEMTARSGDPGSGYALVLDAARRLRDGKLFQRAVEIALQSRSGDAALAASRAWQETLPNSRDARRIELQILIALNRIGETVEPLRAEIAATPQIEKPLLMAVIARNYSRASDKKQAASVVEQALADELKSPATGALAWATIGRMRLNAGDTSGALDAAFKGQQMDPASDAPAALALEMIDPGQPLAEPIVTRYLANNPKAPPDLRIAYARVLVENRRYADSTAQLQALTAARPELAEPWLLLGSLQAQARQDAAAETSLKRYIDLAANQKDPDDRQRGTTQAYLVLSQLAERRKDFTAAERWLARVDGTDELVVAQTRRAGLLARQGKLPQARELVRGLPERAPEDKKQKFLAEVQRCAMPSSTRRPTTCWRRLRRRPERQRPGLRPGHGGRKAQPPRRDGAAAAQADRAQAREPERLQRARLLLCRSQDPPRRGPHADPEGRAAGAGRPFIADSLGWVEFRLGNTTEAIRILETAYKTRPDPEIGAHFGEVLWATGQKDRAVTIWKEALLSDAENETLQETLKRLRVKP